MRAVALTCAGLFAALLFAAEGGWFPHEGGMLKYRVQIRFGEEPEDTMPDGKRLARSLGTPALDLLLWLLAT